MTSCRISKALKKKIKPEGKIYRALTEEELRDIREMREMNCTLECIANEIGCSISTIWYHTLSPDAKKRYQKAHKKNHAEWQKKNGKTLYRRRADRYKKLQEEGLLIEEGEH